MKILQRLMCLLALSLFAIAPVNALVPIDQKFHSMAFLINNIEPEETTDGFKTYGEPTWVIAQRGDGTKTPLAVNNGNEIGREFNFFQGNVITFNDIEGALGRIIFQLTGDGAHNLAEITCSSGIIEYESGQVVWTGFARDVTFFVGTTARVTPVENNKYREAGLYISGLSCYYLGINEAIVYQQSRAEDAYYAFKRQINNYSYSVLHSYDSTLTAAESTIADIKTLISPCATASLPEKQTVLDQIVPIVNKLVNDLQQASESAAEAEAKAQWEDGRPQVRAPREGSNVYSLRDFDITYKFTCSSAKETITLKKGSEVVVTKARDAMFSRNQWGTLSFDDYIIEQGDYTLEVNYVFYKEGVRTDWTYTYDYHIIAKPAMSKPLLTPAEGELDELSEFTYKFMTLNGDGAYTIAARLTDEENNVVAQYEDLLYQRYGLATTITLDNTVTTSGTYTLTLSFTFQGLTDSFTYTYTIPEPVVVPPASEILSLSGAITDYRPVEMGAEPLVFDCIPGKIFFNVSNEQKEYMDYANQIDWEASEGNITYDEYNVYYTTTHFIRLSIQLLNGKLIIKSSESNAAGSKSNPVPLSLDEPFKLIGDYNWTHNYYTFKAPQNGTLVFSDIYYGMGLGVNKDFDETTTRTTRGETIEVQKDETYLLDVYGFEGRSRITVTFTPSITNDGDADGDGKVDVQDVKYLVHQFTVNPSSLKGCDLNNDGVVNILDLVLLIQKLVNK